MPTQTTRISISTTAYTEVSNGHFNVFIRPVSAASLRLHVGQSLPSAETTDWVPVGVSGVSLSDLNPEDRVYLRANGSGSVVAVVRS